MTMAALLSEWPAVENTQPWNASAKVQEAALLIAGTMASTVDPVWAEGEVESTIGESRKGPLSKKS